MAGNLNFLSVAEKDISVGTVVKGTGSGMYQVTFQGYPVLAESMTNESFEENANVLVAEISGSYKILGKYGTTARKRNTYFIKG